MKTPKPPRKKSTLVIVELVLFLATAIGLSFALAYFQNFEGWWVPPLRAWLLGFLIFNLLVVFAGFALLCVLLDKEEKETKDPTSKNHRKNGNWNITTSTDTPKPPPEYQKP